jgi:hypothetical protein
VERTNSIETCYWKFSQGEKYPFLLAHYVESFRGKLDVTVAGGTETKKTLCSYTKKESCTKMSKQNPPKPLALKYVRSDQLKYLAVLTPKFIDMYHLEITHNASEKSKFSDDENLFCPGQE